MSTLTKVFITFMFLFLGVAGYLYYKNNELYKLEQVNRDAEDVARQNAKEDWETALAKEEALLSAIAGLEKQIAGLEEDEASQTATNEELDTDLRRKTQRVTRIAAEEDELLAREEGIRTTVRLNGELQVLLDDIAELTAATNETQGVLDKTIEDDNEVKRRIGVRRTKFEAISNAESLVDMKTTIQSIYPTWGFVTLAGGDTIGIVDNSVLDIVRGEDTIAKLLVTSVEEHSASASIVPGSLAEDVTLMEGDTVVPAKKEEVVVPEEAGPTVMN